MGLVHTADGAPATEPLTTAEAKAHLRVDHSDEDDLIDALIQTARETCETHTKRSLITQTWRMTLDRFPCGDEPIELMMGPVQSVSSITYVDTAGDTQTWAADQYRTDLDSIVPRITPAYGVDYPDTRCVTNAVTITYVAGYGDADDVPEGIKAAMKLLIGHLYENREAVVTGTIATALPFTVEALLSGYVIPTMR